MQTYITQTTAHKYLGQAYYINRLNTGSFTVESEGYEFGFSCFSQDEAEQNAEYKIWNITVCNGMDAVA
tara:strand:+ start:5249 stop:5455 length:207 start_codon:yes stop_codon:yes gene_type:complete